MVGFTLSDRRAAVLDSLYQTLHLFAFGSVPSSPNIYLQIARFLGPLIVGYTALGAVVTVYREQLNRYSIRRMHHHVVIAGLGREGFRLAKAFAADDWSVVAVEQDPTSGAIVGCRERGIRVLVGDATDHLLLQSAGVGRAVLVLAMCGDDRRNLDVAAAARDVSGKYIGQVLTAIVEFENFALWQVMKAQALVDRDESAFRLELVNVWALAAELLLDAHPPFSQLKPGSPHILIPGGDGRAESLVVGILHRWLTANRAPEDLLVLTIAGTQADLSSERFMNNPELKSVPGCEVRAWEVDLLASANFGDLPADVNATYVAMASETDALTVALTLRQHSPRWQDTAIVVAVEDEEAGVGRAIGRGGPSLQGISAFGWLSRTLRPAALLDHTATETIARIGHDLHCRSQRALGLTDEDDPSLVPWEQLRDDVRESNRLWADGIAAKLAGLHCIVVPAPLLDPSALDFEFTDDEVAALAPLEHERWSADMKRMGYLTGPRDARHHPFIDLPFPQLPEENKNKDRAHVRAIPEVLARAGFRIRRLATPDGAKPSSVG
jgi:hypothetical protein